MRSIGIVTETAPRMSGPLLVVSPVVPSGTAPQQASPPEPPTAQVPLLPAETPIAPTIAEGPFGPLSEPQAPSPRTRMTNALERIGTSDCWRVLVGRALNWT